MRLIRTGAIRRRTLVIARAARSRVDDLVVIVGIGSMTYGLALIAEPAGWIFLGLALIAVVALSGNRPR